MHILVINGSPKGQDSITLQTVNYLQIMYPGHTFEVLHAGQRIKALEKDFTPAIAAVRKADLLLFSYPVYTFIAPSQLHRFIELLKEADLDLSQKYATQLSTSKHFYDVTAHRYIRDNCQDLGLRYIHGLSADMDDLLQEKGQKEACAFFEYVCHCVRMDHYEPFPAPLPAPAHKPVEVPEPRKATSGDVVIVTDLADDDVQLAAMIDRFRAVLPIRTRVINLREFPFRGGCLGCFNCAATGKGIYTDGFDTFLRVEIQTTQAIVYAFTIKDHSMGALFKLYDDRQFCNGHRTVTMGMPMAYLISGDYSRQFNLQMIIEGRAQVGGNFLAGIATDEQDPNAEIDRMADALTYAIDHQYVPPQNFYGVGGMKIFRDLIWQMQGMMKADHRFYKEHGQYDFPQKKPGRMLAMYAVGALMSNPKLKAKAGSKMTEGMLMPYKKLLAKAKKGK